MAKQTLKSAWEMKVEHTHAYGAGINFTPLLLKSFVLFA